MFFKRKKEQSTAPAENKIMVGGGGQRIPMFSKRRATILLFVVIILAAAGFLLYPIFNNRVLGNNALIIGAQSFSNKEVNEYLDYPVNQLKQDRNKSMDQLIEMLKVKVAAAELGIKPTEQQVTEIHNESGVVGPLSAKWVYLNSYIRAVTAETEKSKASSYQGYSYILFFGNKVATRGADGPIKGMGNPAEINVDKTYAKQQADKYFDALQKNTMKPEDVLNAIKRDAKLGIDYKAGNNQSIKFGYDSAKPWQQQVLFQELIDEIKAQKKSGLSGEVKVGKVAKVESPASPEDYGEGYYYYVYMDKVQSNLSEQLAEKVKTMKVKRS